MMTWQHGGGCFLYFRRRIEPWEFEFSFDPRKVCKEACLLYEIQWGNNRDVWRHSGKNTTKHVECNFIEKIASERYFCPSIRCFIFWYLSWSPCWECSKAIGEFLNQHPNVTLVIYIARLFQHMDPQNRQGLKDLVQSGVTIQVMRAPGENNTPRILGVYERLWWWWYVSRPGDWIIPDWKSQKWKPKVE